jgi:hypothetical protein
MTTKLVKLILFQALAFGQGSTSLAGSGYNAPATLTVAPGQIITLRFTALKTVLPANAAAQRAASVPLPKSLAGISAVISQTGPNLSEQLPLFAVQQFNQCGGADLNARTPECIVTALTAQIPFDITVPDPKTGPAAASLRLSRSRKREAIAGPSRHSRLLLTRLFLPRVICSLAAALRPANRL